MQPQNDPHSSLGRSMVILGSGSQRYARGILTQLFGDINVLLPEHLGLTLGVSPSRGHLASKIGM